MRPLGVLCVCVLLAASCSNSVDGNGAVETAAQSTAATSSSSSAPTITLPAPTTPGSITATTVPTSTTTPAVTTLFEVPSLEQPILVANSSGVHQVGVDRTITQLVTGPVVYAVDDTQGGLLFQVERGRKVFAGFEGEPPSGSPTIIWWIRVGTSAAQQLLVPTPGAGRYLSLHDAVAIGESFAVVYERHEGTVPFDTSDGRTANMADTLRVFNAASGSVAQLYSVRGYEWDLVDINAGGGLVSATEVQTTGAGCRLLDAAGGEFVTKPGYPSAEPTCFNDFTQCATSCALSSDATRVAYEWVRDNDGVLEREIGVADSVTGTELARFLDPGERPPPVELDLHGDLVLVNRTRDGQYQDRALLVDTSDLGAAPVELPIAGQARFVTRPVDIGAPVAVPGIPLLRADGIGARSFGDLTGTVLESLIQEFGEPSGEVGYEPGGHPLRYVRWDDLGLAIRLSDYGFFRDDSQEHLVGWILGGNSARLTTVEGIGVGSTLAELEAAYPDRVVLEAFCDPGGPPTAAYVEFSERERRHTIRFWFGGGLPAATAQITGMEAGASEGC